MGIITKEYSTNNSLMTANWPNFERDLIKESNIRMVVSGDYVELYEYEKPYFYNWPPPRGGESGAPPVSQGSPIRRADNLYRARRTIRRIIFANQSAWLSEIKFFTFTFKKNVKTISEANKEWSKYTKRLNRSLQKRGFSSAKYLAVIEFQKRGAIHFHVLYFNLPRLSPQGINVATLWGKGFVHAKGLREVRSAGSYVCKYLQKQTLDKRLSGEKAFFTSRGLIKPIEYKKFSTVDDYLKTRTMNITYEQVYQTAKYGFVRYRQLEVNKSKNDTSIKKSSAFAISETC